MANVHRNSNCNEESTNEGSANGLNSKLGFDSNKHSDESTNNSKCKFNPNSYTRINLVSNSSNLIDHVETEGTSQCGNNWNGKVLKELIEQENKDKSNNE